MANDDHIAQLKKGVEAWNAFYWKHWKGPDNHLKADFARISIEPLIVRRACDTG
jgi:hypothetical protein